MELFHCLNRGVDKRKIFMNNQDRFRFIHDLFEFNDQENVNTTYYTFRKSNDININVIARRKMERKPRKLLVDVHAFCLMSNHYHLLLSARVSMGISKFMKKLNMGYARYFNEKYKRKGTLFEGRYKSVAIKDHAHFVHIPYYIHLNPLDITYPEWRERKLKNYKAALAELEKYRWSSHLDYVGKTNFPSVTSREFLSEFFKPDGYKASITNWLKELDLESLDQTTLE